MMPVRFTSQFDTLLGAYAWCALKRHFRPYLKHDAGFVACVCLNIDSLSGYFESAAFSLFGNKAPTGIRIADDDAVVHHLRGNDPRMVPLIMDLDNRRSLFLFSHEAEPPPILRATANIDVEVGWADSALVRGAIYQYRGVRIQDDDAEFLATLSIFDVAIALRSGMSVTRGIALLRRSTSNPPPDTSRDSIPVDVVDTAIRPDLLQELHGYGEAVEWGLQLARDLDDYRHGRIPWEAVDRGLLLVGPPGTGKTRFARVLAEACGARMFEGSYATWQQTGYQSDMLKAMRKTFDQAMKSAPSIVVIDEIDSFSSRSSESSIDKYMRGVVNGLLECLDGLRGRKGVVVVATTNKPNDVDDAVLRSGRIDKHIHVALPDDRARLRILESYLGTPMQEPYHEDLARRTANFSGADLELQVRNAHRLARSRQEATTVEHLIDVLPPSEKIPHEVLWSAVVHECGHLIAGLAMDLHVVAVTINDSVSPTARTHQTGTVEFQQKAFRRITRTTMEADLTMLMAGMAAEIEVLGSHDIGASSSEISDLARATTLATRLEAVHGMGETYISEGAGGDALLDRLRQTNPMIWRRVDMALKETMGTAQALIRENRVALLALADELMRVKRMTGPEINEFLVHNALSMAKHAFIARAMETSSSVKAEN